MEVQVVVDGKELKRSSVVKCLWVMSDDKLQWKEQESGEKKGLCWFGEFEMTPTCATH